MSEIGQSHDSDHKKTDEADGKRKLIASENKNHSKIDKNPEVDISLTLSETNSSVPSLKFCFEGTSSDNLARFFKSFDFDIRKRLDEDYFVFSGTSSTYSISSVVDLSDLEDIVDIVWNAMSPKRITMNVADTILLCNFIISKGSVNKNFNLEIFGLFLDLRIDVKDTNQSYTDPTRNDFYFKEYFKKHIENTAAHNLEQGAGCKCC